MKTLEADFQKAAEKIKKVKNTPSASNLLELYALYKQATTGDVQGSRPGILDLTGRKKYDAWASKKALSKEVAMNSYTLLVEKLCK